MALKSTTCNQPTDWVRVERSRLKELEYAEGLLQALQADGVDNWESGENVSEFYRLHEDDS